MTSSFQSYKVTIDTTKLGWMCSDIPEVAFTFLAAACGAASGDIYYCDQRLSPLQAVKSGHWGHQTTLQTAVRRNFL